MRLADKVIIVTGSTIGIGKAIARKCVSEGAKIIIHGLEEKWGTKLLSELTSHHAVLHIEDIANDNVAKHLVDLAIEKFGKIDGIVNNAALQGNSNIHTTDMDLLRKFFTINTAFPLSLIQASLPYLRQSKGTVLNIGSVNAYSGEPDLLAYSISKGALSTLTRNLGDTLFRSYGIRVNQINPGWVLTETEIARKQKQGLPDDWPSKLPDVYAPAGRILKQEEIANAAVYWLEDSSGPISGQIVDLEQYPFIGRNPPKDMHLFSAQQ